jgi:hypothetical protein
VDETVKELRPLIELPADKPEALTNSEVPQTELTMEPYFLASPYSKNNSKHAIS